MTKWDPSENKRIIVIFLGHIFEDLPQVIERNKISMNKVNIPKQIHIMPISVLCEVLLEKSSDMWKIRTSMLRKK